VSLWNLSGIETGASFWSRDESGGCPVSWPGGVRHGGDVSLICGFRTERGKACPDTVTPTCRASTCAADSTTSRCRPRLRQRGCMCRFRRRPSSLSRCALARPHSPVHSQGHPARVFTVKDSVSQSGGYSRLSMGMDHHVLCWGRDEQMIAVSAGDRGPRLERVCEEFEQACDILGDGPGDAARRWGADEIAGCLLLCAPGPLYSPPKGNGGARRGGYPSCSASARASAPLSPASELSCPAT
jgi:hypothetical protein